MMRPAVLLVLVLLVAGCAQRAEPPAAPSSPGPATPTGGSPTPSAGTTKIESGTPSGNATHRLTRSFDVMAQSEPVMTGDPNCVFLVVPDGAVITGGRVTATRTDAGPLPQKLRVMAGAGVGGQLQTEVGPSGVAVDVPELRHGNAPYVALDAPSDGSAAPTVKQPATLNITLDAIGDVRFGSLGQCHPS